MVLFTASRRNTFVGGTCALPSALLVYNTLRCKASRDGPSLNCYYRHNITTSGFEKQTSAILEFFFRLRLRPYHSSWRGILYQTANFRPNWHTLDGVMTSYTISRWRPRRLHITSGFVFVEVGAFGRSNSTWKENFIQIGPPAATVWPHWFSRWQLRRRSTNSGFVFDNVTVFRKSTSIGKRNFIDIS